MCMIFHAEFFCLWFKLVKVTMRDRFEKDNRRLFLEQEWVIRGEGVSLFWFI